MFVAEELYSQILKVIPIPCVDLLVEGVAGNVLLLRRKNEPAYGQWWFPGGRVLFGEMREAAARRKLEEECGMEAKQFQEIGTYDLLLKNGRSEPLHFITTLLKTQIMHNREIRLDNQSLEARWLNPHEWLQIKLHPFVSKLLREATGGL